MLAGAFVFMANICAIAGVILGILAIRRSYGGVAKALSITGIIVSGVTLLASLILACIYIYVLMEMLF